MATVAAAGKTGGAGRAWRLLTTPAREWDAIAAEPLSAGQVFRQWVIPFAAIGPLAGLIAGAAYGYRLAGFAYYPSLVHGIAGAIVSYLFTLMAVWIVAIAIEALAPNFKATVDRAGAMKLVGYGATAAWLAGLAGLIPGGAWLGLLGLYSTYLVWVGLPIIARPAENRRLPYVAIALIAATCAFLVIALGSSMIAAVISPAPLAATAPAAASLTTPTSYHRTRDAATAVARAEARADAAIRHEEAGVPVAALQGLMPGAVDGFTRRDLGGTADPKGGSRADASFVRDRDSFTITIADEGPPDPNGATASGANIQSSRQSATGFERTMTRGDTMIRERWNRATRAGGYETRFGNRFTVSAQGTVDGLDTLKHAVGAVDRTKLTALAR